MIFEVTMWKRRGEAKSKELHFEGSSNAFCEHLKTLFKDKDWKISLISVEESIVLIEDGFFRKKR